MFIKKQATSKKISSEEIPALEEVIPETEEAPVPEEVTPETEEAPVPEGTDSEGDAAAIVEACVSANVSTMAAGFIRANLSLSQVQMKIEDFQSIRQLCSIAGTPAKAETFISEGKTSKEVQSLLVKEAAQKGDALGEISPSQSPEDVSKDFNAAKNVIMEDIERRKKKVAA